MSNLLQRYEKWGYPQTKITIPKVLRINTLRKPEKQILKQFDDRITLEKIPYLRHGYSYTAPFSLASSPAFLKGDIYIQEAASQIPVQVLNPQETDFVLDMCAAPGSKTTQLAQWMNNKGTIIANEMNIERAKKLQYNLERMGVTNTHVVSQDGVSFTFEKQFDKVLLDAPCSGNFIDDNKWLTKRTIKDFKKMSELQKKLLRQAKHVTKKGGIIVYSTCSLEKEENEEVIEFAQSIGLELVDNKLLVGDKGLTESTQLATRFWPTKMKTQGFFVAKLQKKDH